VAGVDRNPKVDYFSKKKIQKKPGGHQIASYEKSGLHGHSNVVLWSPFTGHPCTWPQNDRPKISLGKPHYVTN